MTGYRVAVEDGNPLAVEPARVAQQRGGQRLMLHGLIAVLSFGLWVPGFLWALLTSGQRGRKFADGYSVRILGGMLVAGNLDESRSVPLDAIVDVSIKKDFVTVSARGAQPFFLFGLRDVHAASRAILEARNEHVRRLRSDVKDEILEQEVGAAGSSARSR